MATLFLLRQSIEIFTPACSHFTLLGKRFYQLPANMELIQQFDRQKVLDRGIQSRTL